MNSADGIIIDNKEVEEEEIDPMKKGWNDLLSDDEDSRNSRRTFWGLHDELENGP